MRWRGRQQSGNVEDRRGMGGKLALGGGAGGLIIVIISLLLGENPLDYINVGTSLFVVIPIVLSFFSILFNLSYHFYIYSYPKVLMFYVCIKNVSINFSFSYLLGFGTS